MKPTSPLSLLLFLSLTTALPLPSTSKLPKDCLHYTTCQPWLREIFDSSLPPKNDHTPATRLPSPHFPSHQLNPPSSSPEAHREVEEEAFNNAPLSPPTTLPPTLALAASRPLHSSYLLSLSNSALNNPPQGEPQSTSTEALPSKPTSALPELRVEDTLRYWATIPTVSVKKEDSPRPCSGNLRAAKPIVMAREYSDLLVVGIVVLFLAAVVVMEAVEYCGDLRSAICGNRNKRRGKIFLDDYEKVVDGKKSFCLQPAPTKYKTPLPSVKEISEDPEKGEYHD